MVDVNVLGLLYCTSAALPIMRAQGSGDIVNVSSVAGRFARAGNAVYAATKFGVGAFSEGLRNEVTEGGIRVTLIEPGFVDTELQSHNKGEVLETLEGMREHDRRGAAGPGHRQRDPLRDLAAAARVGQRGPDPPDAPSPLSEASSLRPCRPSSTPSATSSAPSPRSSGSRC